MSAILATVIMLISMISTIGFVGIKVQNVFAAPPPADAITANPTSLSLNYPAVGPNYKFWAYVDVVNVQGLWQYGVGFNFSAAYLHVLGVENGGFFPTTSFFLNSSADNVAGTQASVGGIDSNAAGHSGSGHLVKILFNVTAWPPYTGTYPGTAVPMITLTNNPASLEQTSLIYNDTATDITPAMGNFHDGTFTLSVTPVPAHVDFTPLTYPPNIYNDTAGDQHFYVTATGGNPGYGSDYTVTDYYWDYGDGSPANHTLTPDSAHTYPAPPALPAFDTWTVHAWVKNSHADYSNNATTTLIVKYSAAAAAIVMANPQLESMAPPSGPGSLFTAYIDVANVTDLNAFVCGFTFDPTALQVVSVSDGGFLASGGGLVFILPGTIDNVGGVVSSWGEAINDTAFDVSVHGHTGAHLLTVVFRVNPALFPPYTGVYPGSPVDMIIFNTDPMSPTQLQLVDGSMADITPDASHIYNGHFVLTVGGTIAPVANFAIVTNPIYVGTTQLLLSATSTPWYNGYTWVPISSYNWVITGPGGYSSSFSTTSTITPITLPRVGTYHVTLTVTAGPVTSAPNTQNDIILARPYGCFIDLTTQNWRYIDPMYLQGVLNGFGYGAPSELFRPGDLVQMYANITYNADEVAGQLVSFQVEDNLGNIVMVGTAISNANGIAEYDWRIPYPNTFVTSEFGAWTARATWSAPSRITGVPYEITQNDTTAWYVSWGLTIEPNSLLGIPAMFLDHDSSPPSPPSATYSKIFPDNFVTATIEVRSDYFTQVTALAAAMIYDDVLVPLGSPAYTTVTFNPGWTSLTFAPLLIPEYAYVGTGTATANLFTTWPWVSGISFCPEVTEGFTILRS